jgi:hypothetical protein
MNICAKFISLEEPQLSLNLKDDAGNCTLFRDTEESRCLVDDTKIEFEEGGGINRFVKWNHMTL